MKAREMVRQVATAWSRTDRRRRTLLLGAMTAAIVVLVLVVRWGSRPEMMVLFSGLDAEDGAAISRELDATNVPHELNRRGSIVRVPADRVGELRIELAARGFTGDEAVGYEILDRTDLPMTDFLQRVNYRRALEGELTRTILALDEVRTARVHLAIPGEEAAAGIAADPTASIVVDLMPGARMRPEQIRGIYALVAASVEGLRPAGVTLVDASGRELDGGGHGEFAATTEQLRIQREVEAHLRGKATALLERVVGSGQAIVQINADLDFDRVDRSVERYNPTSATIRSEERVGNSQDAVLTSYEIDRTMENILAPPGGIRRLSVAVLVNGTTKPNATGTKVYADRSRSELDALAGIVRDAIGFDPERGDSFDIANLKFADLPATELAGMPTPWWLVFPSMGSLIRALLLLLAIGLVAWGLRMSSSMLVEALESERRRREAVRKTLRAEREEGNRGRRLREQLSEFAVESPNEMARNLRAWLVEEKTS
jgi:flagellar M-ring protein FliF